MTGKGEGEQEARWQGRGHSPAGAAKKYPGPLRTDRGVTLSPAAEWLKAVWVVSFPCPEDANKKAEACGERRRPPCLWSHQEAQGREMAGAVGVTQITPGGAQSPPDGPAMPAAGRASKVQLSCGWRREEREGQGRAVGISIGSK